MSPHHRKVAHAIKNARAKHTGNTAPIDTVQSLLAETFGEDPDFAGDRFDAECQTEPQRKVA